MTQLKETPEDLAVRERVYAAAGDELCGFVERLERLDAERQDISEQAKEVLAEAKGRGYSAKILRRVVALRKRDKNELAEEEAILDVYKSALGMG